VAQVRISAEPRTEFGKGAARRIRRAHKVPAVLYGHGTDPRHISLPGHELMLALKGGANTLLEIDVDGATELALPKQVTRDPVRGYLEHCDLLLVRRGEKVVVDVPVLLAGQAAPETLVDQQLTTISVEAEATHIPQSFEISIEGLGVGASIHAGEVPLPSGTTLAGDPEAVVVHILPQVTAEALEAELAEAVAATEPAAAEGEAPAEEPSDAGEAAPAEESAGESSGE